MTPEEYEAALIGLTLNDKKSAYATFRTASHAKMVNNAMCMCANEEVIIVSGCLDERVYKDAIDMIRPGVKIKILITMYGPHWDVPEDAELRYIDEPDQNDRMVIDWEHFKDELLTKEILDSPIDDVVAEGAAGFNKDETAVMVGDSIMALWNKSTPIVR
jgi:hypothetical protein